MGIFKAMMATTIRPILGGRLQLCQPEKGYRTAIEPIFLAAACQAKAGQIVADLGCGVGTAALCLAARCPDVRVVGMDIQEPLIAIAQHNAELNALTSRISFHLHDLTQGRPQEAPFDHIITNPPFYRAAEAQGSPYTSKHIGHIETTATLNDWIATCGRWLKPRGSLVMVHTTQRLDEILGLIRDAGFGAMEVIPLWSRHNQPAKRFIERAIRGRAPSTQLLPGLIVHEGEAYTPAAHALLWEAEALTGFSAPFPAQ